MTNYSRGAAFERKIKKEYESLGLLVIRSAGSRGPADLVVVGAKGETWLIQCKLRKPTKREREAAKAAAKKYGIAISIRWPEGQEVY